MIEYITAGKMNEGGVEWDDDGGFIRKNDSFEPERFLRELKLTLLYGVISVLLPVYSICKRNASP